jgi:hypothetical protein
VKKSQHNTNELKKTMLLAKEKYGYTAWHTAARFGHLKALETLWSFAKEEEINRVELLLSLSEEGEIAFYMAEQRNYQEILQKIWVWAEEEQLSSNELEKRLLLTKGKDGKITWHQSTRFFRLKAFWKWLIRWR